jgi:hypothetical protein
MHVFECAFQAAAAGTLGRELAAEGACRARLGPRKSSALWRIGRANHEPRPANDAEPRRDPQRIVVALDRTHIADAAVAYVAADERTEPTSR